VEPQAIAVLAILPMAGDREKRNLQEIGRMINGLVKSLERGEHTASARRR